MLSTIGDTENRLIISAEGGIYQHNLSASQSKKFSQMSAVGQDSRVSIGILAHNEEPRIAKTLETLFSQDVFEKYCIELVIVPNGCTDETAAVARRSVQEHQSVWSIHGSARVEELAGAGKTNAWNKFV